MTTNEEVLEAECLVLTVFVASILEKSPNKEEILQHVETFFASDAWSQRKAGVRERAMDRIRKFIAINRSEEP